MVNWLRSTTGNVKKETPRRRGPSKGNGSLLKHVGCGISRRQTNIEWMRIVAGAGLQSRLSLWLSCSLERKCNATHRSDPRCFISGVLDRFTKGGREGHWQRQNSYLYAWCSFWGRPPVFRSTNVSFVHKILYKSILLVKCTKLQYVDDKKKCSIAQHSTVT